MLPRQRARAQSLLSAAVAIALLTPLTCFAGVVTIGTYEGPKGGFYDVSESGSTAPNYTPPDPLFSDATTLSLQFTPNSFTQLVVETSTTAPFDLKYKMAQILVPIKAKAGYELTGVGMQLNGSYSLYAPFSESKAKYATNATFSIQVTQVDWQSDVWTSGSSFNGSMSFNRPSTEIAGPQNNFVTDTWSGSSAIDWQEVRTAAGLTADQHITGVSITFMTELAAASILAQARNSVSGYNVDASLNAVPVPEPPTIILAGLGAVAVVANGYRRKKQRRDAEAEMPLDEMEETGAIALTA